MKKLKVLERKDTVRDFYGNFKYDKISYYIVYGKYTLSFNMSGEDVFANIYVKHDYVNLTLADDYHAGTEFSKKEDAYCVVNDIKEHRLKYRGLFGKFRVYLNHYGKYDFCKIYFLKKNKIPFLTEYYYGLNFDNLTVAQSCQIIDNKEINVKLISDCSFSITAFNSEKDAWEIIDDIIRNADKYINVETKTKILK